MQSAPVAGTGASEYRFDLLHCLRGAAALIVVLLHTHRLTGRTVVPGGYLVVDLFFVLSGFVIAHAYEGRLAAGMSFPEFAVARLVRLYPLHLLGLTGGILYFALHLYMGRAPAEEWGLLLVGVVLAFFFLPTPPAISPLAWTVFPLNGPEWSLFFELIANFAYAALFRLLTNTVLVAIVLISFVWLILGSFHYGMVSGGGVWTSFPLGFPRVLFGFFLGVLIRRTWHPEWRMLRRQGLLFVLLNLAVVLVAVIHPDPVSRNGILAGLLVVGLVWPALIVLAVRVELSGVLRQIAHTLGEASYAAYVLHMSLLFCLRPALAATGRTVPLTMFDGYVIVLAVAVLSIAAHHYYDEPVRRWLRRALHARRVREGATQF